MNENENETAGLVAELINDVIEEIPLEARVSIADLKENEFRVLELIQARYIRYRLAQVKEQGSYDLLRECRQLTGDDSLDDAGAAVFILKELWQRLRRTHKLRVVK